MAWIKYKQNFFDEALAYYLRALDEDRNNPIIHKQLGYIYKQKGQGALAVESFKVYLDLLPDASDKSVIQNEMRLLRE